MFWIKIEVFILLFLLVKLKSFVSISVVNFAIGCKALHSDEVRRTSEIDLQLENKQTLSTLIGRRNCFEKKEKLLKNE